MRNEKSESLPRVESAEKGSPIHDTNQLAQFDQAKS